MMASNRKVMGLPGAVMGSEGMQANMKIIEWLATNRRPGFEAYEGTGGWAA